MWNTEEKFNLSLTCGRSDFSPWDPATRNFGACFLYLCMEMPIYAMMAIISAYYIGKRRLSYTCYTAWNSKQSAIIYCRAFIVALLVITPDASSMIRVSLHDTVTLLEVCSIVVKTAAWFLHLMFILRLKRGVSFNTRGPKSIILSWVLTALTSAMVFRSRYIRYSNYSHNSSSENSHFALQVWLYTAGTEALLQGLYLLTMIPGDILLDERHYRAIHTDMRDTYESQAFLNHEDNSYVGFQDDEPEMDLGTAKENVGIFSKLFFWWVTPILKKGSCGFLRNPEDLHELPPYLSTSTVAEYFQLWSASRNSLLKTLHICFGWEFYLIGLLKLASDILGFCGPLLLSRLVRYVEETDPVSEDISVGYWCVGGLFLVTLVGALCNSHFNMSMVEVSLKIKAALVTEIYRKTLSLRKVDIQKFKSGEIINFLSTDTARIVNACPSFHALWSQPLQVGVSLYLLYKQIGGAFLAGVVFIIILIPINRLLAKKIGDLSTKMMKFKDDRVNLMSEILYGIRVVKFHAWERFFTHRIKEIREKELTCLKGRKYLDAMCVYFWATTPVLVSVLTFTTFVLLGHQLTAAQVFTSLALFNMLINPLNALPWVLNGVVEAWVSIKRVNALLSIDEISPALTYDKIPEDFPGYIHAENASFSWQDSGCGLQNLNFTIKKSQFVGIVGEVGAGKSNFLLSLLGELDRTHGKLLFNDYQKGFGIVPQEAWIQRGTIRANVLFGERCSLRYKTVLDSCGLKQDLDELEHGDETLVGDNGLTLSGGQKARISLARAVYQNKDVYLLDDIFSAVDYKVAKHINQHCLQGLLKEKTRIICTHHFKFLKNADWILVLDKGKIINQGTPAEILPIFDDIDDEPMLSLVNEEIPSCQRLEFETSCKANVDEEVKAEGTIKAKIYQQYINAVGVGLTAIILISLLAMQISRNASDFWLAHWISATTDNSSNIPTTTLTPTVPAETTTRILPKFEHNESYYDVDDTHTSDEVEDIHLHYYFLSGLDPNVRYYFTVYVIIGIANSFMTLARAFFFAYGSILGGKRIHKSLFRSVIKAKMNFFDLTPVGRILNRFSSDQGIVDDSLPFIMNILLAQFFGLLGTLVVTCFALPWILVTVIPMLLVANNIQKYYRHTSRQLRRIASVSLSPVYAHLSETLKGLVIIRGLRAVNRFQSENEDKLEANQKSEYATQAVSQWLGIRLQMVGVVIITGVGLVGVLQHGFQMGNSAMLGLAISYALTITNTLSSFVTSFTETEKEMVAVERVSEYMNTVEAESNLESLLTTPYGWPSQGVITFQDVSLQYRRDLPYALKNIHFETRSHEKIGVVGRTGSGKSSLFQALFRMVDNFGGVISIDTVNTKNLNLKYLRKKLCIIPQDPLIFSGSLRENMDPEGHHRDDQLLRALDKCQLRSLLSRLGGLDGYVGENGNLMSVGQKQLLCLSRAILTNPKILCIDEATANVDQETDKIIQSTIRTSFGPTTVITIAHRVNTILHSDRVLVLRSGEVVEFDSPQTLLEDKNSYFYKLARGYS